MKADRLLNAAATVVFLSLGLALWAKAPEHWSLLGDAKGQAASGLAKIIGLIWILCAVFLANPQARIRRWALGIGATIVLLNYGLMSINSISAGKMPSWGQFSRLCTVLAALWISVTSKNLSQFTGARGLLRLGLAAAFFSHGWKSFQGADEMRHLAEAFYAFLGLEFSVLPFLQIVGLSDMTFASLLLLSTKRIVPLWMAIWATVVGFSVVFSAPWNLVPNLLNYAPYVLTGLSIYAAALSDSVASSARQLVDREELWTKG